MWCDKIKVFLFSKNGKNFKKEKCYFTLPTWCVYISAPLDNMSKNLRSSVKPSITPLGTSIPARI